MTNQAWLSEAESSDPTGSSVRFSPMMTRVGGLDARALDAVVPRVDDLLGDVSRAEDRLDALAEPLIEILFSLVPRLDDDIALRRRVLAAKRAVNRRSTWTWDEDTRSRLTRWMDAGQLDLVAEWENESERLTTLLAKLGAELAAHRDEAAASLVAVLDDEQFTTSLAVAAPDWLRYGKVREPGRLSSRNLQTLYSYVGRAALKTSPFSGLTTVGVAGTTGRGAARSRTSATVGYLALLHLARSAETAALLRYRPAVIRPGGPDEPNGLLVHSEFTIAGGTAWRNDRVVEADHARRWIDCLPVPPDEGLQLVDVLAALGGSDPFTRYRRLLDTGVLRPVPPWGTEDDPLRVLARLAASPPTAGLSSFLGHADQVGRAVVRQGAGERLRSAATIGRLAAEWMDDTDAAAVPSGLIYEDRETDLHLTDVRAVPAVQQDLHRVAALIRPYIFRSHLYDLLVRSFVAEFGAGGSCTDPLAFLMRLTVDRDSNAAFDAAVTADFVGRADPAPRAYLPVGPTSAPPNAGLLFQLDAPDEERIRLGDYRMVLNHFSSGTGGLFGRFADLLGPDFRRRLRDYVSACWPDVAMHQLTLWTDCNTVQAECAGLFPPLMIPGELRHRDGTALDDTVLLHDATQDTLSLVGRDGEPIGLGYLSLVPAHLLQSYVRLLAVIADPWVNASPHTDYTLTKYHELAPHIGDSVVELERVQDDRVVTRRRSWMVPAAALPVPAGPGGEAAYLVAMERFRRRHGIPDAVFVHQLGGFAMGGLRKPMWVALNSPISLEVFRHWLGAGTTHLRFVEVLPGPGGRHQRDDERRPRVTEHAVLLSWPRPGGSDE